MNSNETGMDVIILSVLLPLYPTLAPLLLPQMRDAGTGVHMTYLESLYPRNLGK